MKKALILFTLLFSVSMFAQVDPAILEALNAFAWRAPVVEHLSRDKVDKLSITERISYYHKLYPDWTTNQCEQVAVRVILTGMTTEQCMEVLGPPHRPKSVLQSATSTVEVWYYTRDGYKELFFENGKLYLLIY
jgi:hypothetical protein